MRGRGAGEVHSYYSCTLVVYSCTQGWGLRDATPHAALNKGMCPRRTAGIICYHPPPSASLAVFYLCSLITSDTAAPPRDAPPCPLYSLFLGTAVPCTPHVSQVRRVHTPGCRSVRCGTHTYYQWPIGEPAPPALQIVCVVNVRGSTLNSYI